MYSQQFYSKFQYFFIFLSWKVINFISNPKKSIKPSNIYSQLKNHKPKPIGINFHQKLLYFHPKLQKTSYSFKIIYKTIQMKYSNHLYLKLAVYKIFLFFIILSNIIFILHHSLKSNKWSYRNPQIFTLLNKACLIPT